MTSAGPGPGTSRVEISRLSADGFRLRLGEEELTDVERPSPDHLYWPSLDIDLAVESIRHPEIFPLVSRGSGRS